MYSYDATPPNKNVVTVEWYVNFADPSLFYAYGSSLFAQGNTSSFLNLSQTSHISEEATTPSRKLWCLATNVYSSQMRSKLRSTRYWRVCESFWRSTTRRIPTLLPERRPRRESRRLVSLEERNDTSTSTWAKAWIKQQQQPHTRASINS